MAQDTRFYPSQNVSVWYQKETEVGIQPDDAALTKMQSTSFTIPEYGVPLEFSAARSGQFVTTAGQGHHSEGTKMWTFDTTMRGTPTALLLATEAVFESAANPGILQNTYAFPKNSYVNASSNSPGTFDIRFEDAGSDSTHNNHVLNGCVGTGFTIGQDIGSEGGEMTCTINWATGYPPNTVVASGANDADDAITSPSYDTGNPYNIRSLTAASSEIDSGNDMVIQSWELSASRTIERIHYKDTTAGVFAPFGYAMTGGFDVTGSMTVIRNNDVHDLMANFRNSTTVDINLTDGTLVIGLDKCLLNEPSIDTGGAVLTNTIPFTVVGADDVSSATTMVSITRS